MMKTTALSLTLVTFMISACGGQSDSPRFDQDPIFEHLGNVIAVSALDEDAVKNLQDSIDLVSAEGASRESIKGALDKVRSAAMSSLSSFADREPLEPIDEIKERSLVDIMNLTHAIGEANKIELKIKQVVHKGHKCDRVGSGGICEVNSAYNCSHMDDGSCFHTIKR